MTPDFPSSETLQAEAASLTLPRFAEAEALALGHILTELGRGLTIVINIRTPDRTLFHAALPGSGPINDRWIQRKSATALLFQEASLAVGVRTRAVSRTIDVEADPIAQSAKLETLRKMTKRVQKLGGVGPTHVNSPEWKNKMALRMKAKQFSEFNE